MRIDHIRGRSIADTDAMAALTQRSPWSVRTLCATLLLLAGCSAPATLPPPVHPPTPAGALQELEQLPVKGKAPATGYNRTLLFLPHGWADPDRNGCNARRDALERQAVADVVKAGPHQCVVTATIWDPYTAARIPSTRADTDHVVALSNAWQTGAQQLTATDREAFANDPANLVVTSESANRQKGDSSADAWLPPNKPYRCTYVQTQIHVKTRYRLWVTRPEADAMRNVLNHCPSDTGAQPAAYLFDLTRRP